MRVEFTQSIRSRLSVAPGETASVTRSAPLHHARRPLVTVSPFNGHVCAFVVPTEEKGARPRAITTPLVRDVLGILDAS
jgi:hypothetical protein